MSAGLSTYTSIQYSLIRSSALKLALNKLGGRNYPPTLL
jgi:hypothetical protein